MINLYRGEPFGLKVKLFESIFTQIRDDLVSQRTVNVGEWQSQHSSDKFQMKELLGVVFSMPMPSTKEEAAEQTGARMPWAEDHFQERVGGAPLNPSPSEAWWPFRQKKDGDTNTDHKSEGNAFSHTYPERMWPKRAGQEMSDLAENDPMRDVELGYLHPENYGIRFAYGDLRDVVKQLQKHPMTRQAYLPIWFPEDTGAVHGKRVPCTLGYHFIIRDGKLHVSYFMRSTDLLRHFQDDIYMAIRLAQWVTECLEGVHVGELHFHTANMHIFEGDVAMIDFWKSQGKVWF